MSIATIQATMSSREIAELVDSNHADVRRSIERLAERGVITLPPLAEVPNDGPGPKSISVYLVGKRDSYVIVAQLSPEFTARLVDRWQELEAGLAPKLPQTFAQALMLAAQQAEQIEQQAAQLAIAAPAVAFVDKFVEAKSSKCLSDVAKLLGWKPQAFFAALAADGIIFKRGGSWVPFQTAIDSGRFTVKTGEASGHAYQQARITPAGVAWLAKNYQMAEAV